MNAESSDSISWLLQSTPPDPEPLDQEPDAAPDDDATKKASLPESFHEYRLLPLHRPTG